MGGPSLGDGGSLGPSCDRKRRLLWAERLCQEVLAKIARCDVAPAITRLLGSRSANSASGSLNLGEAGEYAPEYLVEPEHIREGLAEA